MKRHDPRFQPMQRMLLASVSASGLEPHSNAIEGRLDSGWTRHALAGTYGLQGGEVVAVQMALELRDLGYARHDADFWAYKNDAGAMKRLNRAYAGGYAGR
jgi:hypothetical protein